MPKCLNCQHEVDFNAAVCPWCGRPGAGREEPLAIAIIGVVVVVFVLVFGCVLAPAILVIWPFSYGLGDAFSTAFGSFWAWTGSLTFWGIVGFVGYQIYQSDTKPKPSTSAPILTEKKEKLPSPSAPVVTDEKAKEWFVRRGNQEQGPITSGKLKQLAGLGKLSKADLVRASDQTEWQSAGKIKGLFGPNT